MKPKKYPLTQKQGEEIERICNFRDWKRITKKYDVSNLVPAALYKTAWYYGFKVGFNFQKKIKAKKS